MTAKKIAPNTLKNNQGFTLIEMIAVLAIIGILGSIAVPRFVDLGASSAMTSLYNGVVEINGRESILWTNLKISQSGWLSDADLFSQLDTELGGEFKWTPEAQIDGAKLHFKEKALTLQRMASTNNSPGRWLVTKEN